MCENPTPTVEPNEYVLREYGIAQPIRLLGVLTQLLPIRDVPVVFLIDESHTEECIAQNIGDANELVRQCNIQLIGVESHLGGFRWDDRTHRYTNDAEPENLVPANTHPQFAERMRQSGARVLGVECRGLSDELECDLLDNPNGGPIQDRPINIARSEHFIRTLFQLRNSYGLDGNLILNAGGNHNTHIANWIGDGTIEAKAGQRAAYVRLRPPAYPK